MYDTFWFDLEHLFSLDLLYFLKDLVLAHIAYEP